jgi:hypothetical protein
MENKNNEDKTRMRRFRGRKRWKTGKQGRTTTMMEKNNSEDKNHKRRFEG